MAFARQARRSTQLRRPSTTGTDITGAGTISDGTALVGMSATMGRGSRDTGGAVASAGAIGRWHGPRLHGPYHHHGKQHPHLYHGKKPGTKVNKGTQVHRGTNVYRGTQVHRGANVYRGTQVHRGANVYHGNVSRGMHGPTHTAPSHSFQSHGFAPRGGGGGGGFAPRGGGGGGGGFAPRGGGGGGGGGRGHR